MCRSDYVQSRRSQNLLIQVQGTSNNRKAVILRRITLTEEIQDFADKKRGENRK